MKITQSTPIRILLIDDDEDDYIITRDNLESIPGAKNELVWEKSYHTGLNKLLSGEFDICLIDYHLGEKTGIDLIIAAIAGKVSIPLILLTGQGDKNIDLKAMKEGATDYLIKSEINPQLLERTIRYSLNNSQAFLLLKQSEDKYRQLFQRSFDGIFLSDTAYRITDINPSFLTLIKIPSERIVGIQMETLFADISEWEKCKKHIEENKQVRDLEAQLIISDDGERIHCQISIIERTDHQGIPIGYQGFVRDLTLRKESEKQLLIAEKLSQAAKMARSIAHEVRNPLTNLDLAIGQLKSKFANEDEDMRFLMDVLQRNSGRIGRLVTEMINSFKPKNLLKENQDLINIIENAIDLIADRVKLKNIQLSRNYMNQPLEMPVDSEQLKIAVSNVLVNAVEAVDENKGKLEIDVVCENEKVKIIIKDNGKGIAKENLTSLFDPFYTNKKGGMGLGLTTTQNILSSHGGSIEVKSKPNEGTSFIITLPLACTDDE